MREGRVGESAQEKEREKPNSMSGQLEPNFLPGESFLPSETFLL